MTSVLLRGGLWLSFAVVVVAVYLGLQGRVQEVLTAGPRLETFCYSQGVTEKFSTQASAACFTVEDGVFGEVFTPKSDPAEIRPGHAIPGLWDGHGHLAQYGEFLHSVDLFGSTSVKDAKNRLAAYVSTHEGAGSKDDWIRGVGWDQMVLNEMPTAAMLADFNDLYIMLDRVDVHCIWVSQAVLDLLPDDLADIPGGEIVREPGMGVFCDNAMEVVMKFWPRPDEARKSTFLKSAMASLHSVGLVGMHDAGVYTNELQLYKDLFSAGDWTLRVYAMIECEERNTFCPEKASAFTDSNGFLSIRSVKLFADGALGSWGSAMIEPYSDRPYTSGSLLVNASTLTSLARSWASEGYQVNIHAIGGHILFIDHAVLKGACIRSRGMTSQRAAKNSLRHAQAGHILEDALLTKSEDLANRLALDAMEAALIDLCPGEVVSVCQAKHRFRIEHIDAILQRIMTSAGWNPARGADAEPTFLEIVLISGANSAQIIHPHDQARMRSMGIIPSIQPTHATSDMSYAELRLGSERTSTEAYMMHSLLDLQPVLGSDFPVEPPNPFEGIYAAVVRKSPHTGKGADGSTESWHREEALTLREALVGFTEGPARAAFLDGKAGVIQPGAMADWVVLDEPLESIEVEDIRHLQVKETWVGGRLVYSRD